MNIIAQIECETIIPESPTVETTDKDAEERIRRMNEEFDQLGLFMSQAQNGDSTHRPTRLYTDDITPTKAPSENKVSVNAQLLDENGGDMSVDDILNAVENGCEYVTIDFGDNEDVAYEFSVWASECEATNKLQEKVSENGGDIDFSHKNRREIDFSFKNRMGVDRWARLNSCMICKKISDCRYVLEIKGISFVKK